MENIFTKRRSPGPLSASVSSLQESAHLSATVAAEQSEGTSRTKRRRRRQSVASLTLAASALIGSFTIAPTASAATVGSCTGSIGGWLTQDVCVQANMGAKSGGRQFVYSVTLINRTGTRALLEGWGPNSAFYFRTYSDQQTFTVNKWVSAGGICARLNKAAPSDAVLTTCISVKP